MEFPMRNRIALLGSALMGAALLCAAGAAKAQDYGPYEPGYYGDAPETVIVHPYYHRYDGVEKRQMVGRINGEINPTEYSLSRPVSIGDLDLSNPADRSELRLRIRHTARELCYELNERVPGLRGYPSEDRDCVQRAMREAMRDVYYGRG
jgi:UrcA family protein